MDQGSSYRGRGGVGRNDLIQSSPPSSHTRSTVVIPYTSPTTLSQQAFDTSHRPSLSMKCHYEVKFPVCDSQSFRLDEVFHGGRSPSSEESFVSRPDEPQTSPTLFTALQPDDNTILRTRDDIESDVRNHLRKGGYNSIDIERAVSNLDRLDGLSEFTRKRPEDHPCFYRLPPGTPAGHDGYDHSKLGDGMEWNPTATALGTYTVTRPEQAYGDQSTIASPFASPFAVFPSHAPDRGLPTPTASVYSTGESINPYKRESSSDDSEPLGSIEQEMRYLM